MTSKKRLRAELDEYAELCDNLANLLTRTVNVLRGDPPHLTSWSWHDIPDLAEAMARELDALRCRVHGHDWVRHRYMTGMEKAAPMMVCSRRFCDQVGWKVGRDG